MKQEWKLQPLVQWSLREADHERIIRSSSVPTILFFSQYGWSPATRSCFWDVWSNPSPLRPSSRRTLADAVPEESEVPQGENEENEESAAHGAGVRKPRLSSLHQ